MTLKNRRFAVLAEDEPAILMALDEVLTSRGFATIPCTDGASALETIRSKQPSLAVFDVNMPRLSGTDVALRLRMVDVMNDLRILLITGRDDLRTRRMILASGADDFIIKPFDLKSFLGSVDSLMEGPSGRWLEHEAWYSPLPAAGPGHDSNQLPPQESRPVQAYSKLISMLVRSLDERSLHQPYHSVQVAHLAQLVAHRLGLDAGVCSRVRAAGLVHDLGLLFLPDAIVNKPGPLDEDELARIRQHSFTGANILEGLPPLAGAAPAVLHHHERWDGVGYPDGLAAEAIPLEARILAVADAFAAMTTRRLYAPPLPLDEAIAELDLNAGRQFDPAVVEAFHAAAVL